MKKHIKDWDIGFVFTEFTYDCIIEGGVSKGLNEQIIVWSKSTLKKLGYDEEECVNVFEDYVKDGILKPVKIMFKVYKYEPQEKAYVITFCNHEETAESIIQKIVENNKLKTVEWDW